MSVRIARPTRVFARLTAVLVTVLAAVTGIALSAVAPASASPSGRGKHGPSWQLVDTGVTSHYRGLSVVNRSVVWLGGYDGTVLRTVDGGRRWRTVSPAGATTLQFRDIQGFDARHAVAMAAGSGTDSRLYATSDGGAHWSLAYQNTDPAAFFDCMAFSNRRDGLVLSDPVDGRFRILATRDSGRSWRVLPNSGMPEAQTGEAGFAASGECLTMSGHDAWFGSGGGAVARIYHSRDGGRHWSVTTAPQPSSESSGVFALAFRTRYAGVAVGGDFANPAVSDNVAATSFAGRAWRSSSSQPSGYRSGLTWLPRTRASLVAVGLTGSDVSYDAGRHWTTFDTGQFDTVSCSRDGACWASGDLGRVARLRY